MKDTLQAGLKHSFSYTIPRSKTVPALYTESPEFQAMPEVFATGCMIGLMEWACVRLLSPHLDPGEGSVGVHVDISHVAATPPGLTVTVEVELTEVKGRRAWFHVRAQDGIDMIGEGYLERFIVNWERFNKRVAEKAKAAGK